MNVLLIDDCKEDRELIKNYMKETQLNENGKLEDINIEESEDLTKGFNKIKKTEFDTILLDLGLPESEGVDTINSLINFLHSLHKNIPIIILTGLEDYNIGEKAFKLGIKDFLIKQDTNTKELLRALKFSVYYKNLAI